MNLDGSLVKNTTPLSERMESDRLKAIGQILDDLNGLIPYVVSPNHVINSLYALTRELYDELKHERERLHKARRRQPVAESA